MWVRVPLRVDLRGLQTSQGWPVILEYWLAYMITAVVAGQGTVVQRLEQKTDILPTEVQFLVVLQIGPDDLGYRRKLLRQEKVQILQTGLIILKPISATCLMYGQDGQDG